MELGEMISLYRKEAGLTIDELAVESGVSKGAINKIISGETKAPTLDKMKALAKALGKTLNDFMDDPVSIDYEFSREEFAHIKKYRVLDTHGKRVVDHVLDDEYDRMTHIESREEKGSITYITLYDLAVSAGTGEPLGDTYYSTKLEIPTEEVPEEAHCCLRVNGDSMEPAYKDGDVVFVRRQDEPVREGEIGIFSLNGEGYMKRLGHKELESLNPKYPAIPIRQYDELRCFGKVLGKLSK
ncbi:MAG: XRE family transcriptional regulator [Acutalibacter sp.]